MQNAPQIIIKSVKATPLYVEFKEPYYWAQGTNYGAKMVLIEIESETGTIGFGESFGAPNCEMTIHAYDALRPGLVGMDASNITAIMAYCHQAIFASQGPGNHRKLSLQVTAGLEMALWDLLGKINNTAVHKMLGGAQRDYIQYFGFAQGKGPDELALDAKRYADAGHEVIYMKIGRGQQNDLGSVAAVREAIGNLRLRADANENWDMLTARRMIAALKPYKIEMIEQPVDSSSLAALAQLRNSVDTPIAADQAVHTFQDVYNVCQTQAADLIVLGLHECGGILNFIKAAAVAEASGLNVCIHGNFETSITTCAAHQAGLVIPNLDDANQIMGNFLSEDIIASPNMEPVKGRLAAIDRPGLGFELDADSVQRAAKAYRHLAS
ncbi:MAG: mandelate racemase/muconate lactonizing enzyme family protein [Gammaproteobacteria bacterium]|nr:mandelate racemase/muconate lactonizing enzyme family protein [Gammaproteobacteria bacterium]